MYLNKAMVIGNLTRDPEMRSLPSGIQVANFSLATNRVWKDKNGAKQESADFHNIVVFGRQAEIVGQYLKKGSSALVEGRMQTRSWDAPDGQKKYRTEIVADRVQFGPRSGSAPSSTSGQASSPSPKSGDSQSNTKVDPSSRVDKSQGVDSIEYPTEEINPEDIPF